MSVTWWILDIFLVLVLIAHAVHGYRRGFVLTLIETVGFVAGAAVALMLVPGRIDQVTPEHLPSLRPVLVAVAVLVLATVGQFLAVRISRPLFRRRRPSPARHVDRVLGAVVTTSVAVLVLWFVAGMLQLVAPPWVKDPITQSRVLQAVDGVMPRSSERVLGQLIAKLNDYGFPRAVIAAEDEPRAPVAPGDAALTQRAAIQAVRPSVVRVDATALRCGSKARELEGSGWVASPGVVVTNAHVVAGAETIEVRTGYARSERRMRARVIAFDPQRDVAVLYASSLTAPALRMGGVLNAGDSAVVAGYPERGPYHLDAARVRRTFTARGLDIYNSGEVEREVYALRASIQRGNSGGPLLAADGSVVGLVFARSPNDDATAYALTLDEVRPVLDSAHIGRSVGTGGQCAAMAPAAATAR